MKHLMSRPVEIAWAFAAALVVLTSIALATTRADTSTRQIQIKAISTDASRVTGGDVLVQITTPDRILPKMVKVTVGGRDLSSVFRPAQAPHTLMGLVT